jgi:Evolutionarily conserved signalling intermediate in Toll pathway
VVTELFLSGGRIHFAKMHRLQFLRSFLSSFQKTESASIFPRALSLSCAHRSENNSDSQKHLATKNLFDVKEKNKNSYIDMIRKFNERSLQKRGQVEFVYAAMNHMDEFGVSKDLIVYKALIETFPKGKMIPRNMFQAEFQHYPKHQQCAIDLLEKMENNGLLRHSDLI